MRFMIIVKATQDSEAGVMPEEKLFAEMATYHEELAKAGMLIDGSGLQPSSKGWRIKYSGAKRTFVDGPFTEKRFPNPAGEGKPAEVEVRQLFELEDFEPNPELERFREMGMSGAKK